MKSKELSRKILAERLNEVYRDAQLNQMDFAAKSEMTQASVSRYLCGSLPNLKAVYKIALHHGVSVDWLLGLSKEKKRA